MKVGISEKMMQVQRVDLADGCIPDPTARDLTEQAHGPRENRFNQDIPFLVSIKVWLRCSNICHCLVMTAAYTDGRKDGFGNNDVKAQPLQTEVSTPCIKCDGRILVLFK